jgi:predicted AAA+ superfamily ATPase
MDPWYKHAVPRREVREGRSFSPDEFAIALEQVIAGTAPDDYTKPGQFPARTCFTRALKGRAGMVLRRLSGETSNTAPVLTLITQFGGGKTHTLATLYHLANAGPPAADFIGVSDRLREAGLAMAPTARVGVFVGNAWDPQPGRETPWIDLARQIAGDKGVEALGATTVTTPPGTEAIGRVFAAANMPILVLLDEVLNFVNRHRGMGDSLFAFLHNLTVAVTGTTRAAAVISLPRSQVEMTELDQEWHDRITKVVRRVARASRRSGWRSTRPRLRQRHATSCATGSRLAIHSIRPPSRFSSANGGRLRNFSRRAARLRCWRDGSPWQGEIISTRERASR